MIAILIWGETVRPDSREGLANFNEVKMKIKEGGRNTIEKQFLKCVQTNYIPGYHVNY